MNDTNHAEAVAVLCENEGPIAQGVRHYMASRNLTSTQWYTPLDMDALDTAIRQGQIARVVIPELPTLLAGIWNGRITFEQWLSAGVHLDFVNTPDTAPESLTRLIFESWQSWQGRHRHRQAIAGAILSAIIILVVFLFTAYGV